MKLTKYQGLIYIYIHIALPTYVAFNTENVNRNKVSESYQWNYQFFNTVFQEARENIIWTQSKMLWKTCRRQETVLTKDNTDFIWARWWKAE